MNMTNLGSSGFQLESEELFSDSALGDFFTQDYELLNNNNSNSNNAMEDSDNNSSSNSGFDLAEEDILGKIVVDLKIPQQQQHLEDDQVKKIVIDLKMPQQQQQQHEDEELKTAGLGVTEDPFFAVTSKAANLFQEDDLKVKDHEVKDPTQALIDEMEEFLQQHQQQPDEDIEVNSEAIEVNSEAIGVNSEAIEVNSEAIEFNSEAIIGEEEAQKLLDALMEDESGLSDEAQLNSVSRLVDESGQEIIIVIANDDDLEDGNVPSTASSEVEMESDDSDWSPAQDKRRSSKRANAGRHSKYVEVAEAKVTKRGRKSSSMYHGVKDKKERKKLQNVVAARRYRDKKKHEVFENEAEEGKLRAKNDKLKAKLAEMEGEVKTLKKLVVELGLVKNKRFKR